MITILLHIQNSEPIKVDLDELPNPTDVCILCRNPRDRKDGELPWVERGVTTVIIPWWRITYVQVLPSGEEEIDFPLPFRDA